MNDWVKCLAGILVALFIAGCADEAAKEKPIPPDDLSNGPWKYQKGGAKPPQ